MIMIVIIIMMINKTNLRLLTENYRFPVASTFDT